MRLFDYFKGLFQATESPNNEEIETSSDYWSKITQPPKPLAERVSAEYDQSKRIMTVHFDDNSIGLFKGSDAYWSTYPMMESTPTRVKLELLDIYNYIQEHGNPYPTAHLKNEAK